MKPQKMAELKGDLLDRMHIFAALLITASTRPECQMIESMRFGGRRNPFPSAAASG